MAMAALSQLPTAERNIIMDGLREIVKMYSQKDASIKKTDSVLGWWPRLSKE